MSKWISGREVLEEIEDEELFSYLSNGLQPYSKSEQQPIPCEYSRHRANFLFECKHKRVTARLHAIDYFLQFGENLHEQQETIFPANNYEWLAFDYFQDKLDLFQELPGLEALVVSPADSATLYAEKEKAEKELAEVEAEIEVIVTDDPDLQNWRYFVIPEAREESQEVITSLAAAIFKYEDLEKCSLIKESCHNLPERFLRPPFQSGLARSSLRLIDKLPL